MREQVITGHGGPTRLAGRQAPDPEPGPGELRVRVAAVGVNFADVLARQGLYPGAPRPPFVPGYEASGRVDAVGPGVGASRIGSDVVALTRFGAYTDVLVVPSAQALPLPAGLTPEQGAALPVSYLTAWALLVVMGSLTAADTVVVHNAGGAAGLAQLDIAVHVGARVVGTASAWKHPFLRERGAPELIDPRAEDWVRRVRTLTDDHGAELITDPRGGRLWRESYRALRPTGRLGVYGVSSATARPGLPGPVRLVRAAVGGPLLHPIALMNRNVGVFGVHLGRMWQETEKTLGWAERLLAGVGEGWVRPRVDRAFPLEQAAAAHAYLEARRNLGKVVLVP
ncbi:zinc-binding dehydrogenase [Georgenia yuyongxinii]|uniref:Zinc-binding dehydrogenase n=1 Tax=Georgenia yuyongxinii TaxID=2589797 RepID=A0A552WMJ2_9MICO|nr:zinc-binding dehydrogenase [Georgenia yuyongxinii]TRW43986.1 zinc-binding dehydrogenase [Georgenia yuyongxinii]